MGKKATGGFEDCPVIAWCASNMLRCTARILIDTWLCTVHPPTLSKTLYNSFVLCSQALTATCTNKVFFYFRKLIRNQEGRRGCFDLHENLVSYSVAEGGNNQISASEAKFQTTALAEEKESQMRCPDSMMLRGWIFSLVAWNSMEHFTF